MKPAFFLSFLLFAIAACTSESSQNTVISDTMVYNFPELQTMNPTVIDSVFRYSREAVQEYYRYQTYAMGGSSEPFTGVVEKQHWKLDHLTQRGEFRDGKLQQLTIWYDNGAKNQESYYNNRFEEEGIYSRGWYPGGELHFEDKPGQFVMYYEDGSVKSRTFGDSRIDYWPNGQKQVQWSYNSSDLYQLDGPMKVWHRNGRLGITGEYVNNKKEGIWMEYDSLGTLIKKEVYEDGKPVAANQND